MSKLKATTEVARIRLGRSELNVSRIAFGTWQLGGDWGATDEEAAISAIRYAYDRGINFFDTAQGYGFGASEQLLAKAIKGYARQDVVIATKGGLRSLGGAQVERDASADAIRKGVDDTRRRTTSGFSSMGHRRMVFSVVTWAQKRALQRTTGGPTARTSRATPLPATCASWPHSGVSRTTSWAFHSAASRWRGHWPTLLCTWRSSGHGAPGTLTTPSRPPGLSSATMCWVASMKSHATPRTCAARGPRQCDDDGCHPWHRQDGRRDRPTRDDQRSRSLRRASSPRNTMTAIQRLDARLPVTLWP